jgi:transposase-like protein
MRRLEEKRRQAITLRQEYRLSAKEIAKRLQVSESSLSSWLRPYPLTATERRAKSSQPGNRHAARPRRTRIRSRLHQLFNGAIVDSARKGKIAEAAILLRLVILGYNVYSSVFDGDKFDWVISSGQQHTEPGQLRKIEVRWLRQNSKGDLTLNMRCSNGRGKERRMTDFDALVGYDMFEDVAYVYRPHDLAHVQHAVNVTSDAAEAWWKLRGPNGN